MGFVSGLVMAVAVIATAAAFTQRSEFDNKLINRSVANEQLSN